MRRRLLNSLGVATTLATVLVLLQFAAVSVGGQAHTTPWGHPNLEGDLARRLRYAVRPGPRHWRPRVRQPAEERAARDQARMINPGRNERSGLAARDVAGAYNAVFTSAKPAGPRTSLVVDPPNGRVPALTAEATQRAEVQREWRLMLLQNTETCEHGAPGCAGGEARATVAATFRCAAILQYVAHEPPRWS